MTDALTGDKESLRGDLEDLICEHWTCMLSNSTVPECPAASPCPACVMRSRALALLSPAAPVAGDVETVARIIDGDAFDGWQGLYDHCVKQNDGDFATRCADSYYLPKMDAARAKAREILSAISSMRKEDERAKADAEWSGATRSAAMFAFNEAIEAAAKEAENFAQHVDALKPGETVRINVGYRNLAHEIRSLKRPAPSQEQETD